MTENPLRYRPANINTPGHWNHRIIVFEAHMAVHAVSYDDDDNPISFDAHPAVPAGANPEELACAVEWIGAALTMAPLRAADFPERD